MVNRPRGQRRVSTERQVGGLSRCATALSKGAGTLSGREAALSNGADTSSNRSTASSKGSAALSKQAAALLGIGPPARRLERGCGFVSEIPPARAPATGVGARARAPLPRARRVLPRARTAWTAGTVLRSRARAIMPPVGDPPPLAGCRPAVPAPRHEAHISSFRASQSGLCAGSGDEPAERVRAFARPMPPSCPRTGASMP